MFASLALELIFAYSIFPVSLLLSTGDPLAQSKLYVFIAQISLGFTTASFVLIILGILGRRGLIPTHRRLIVRLSWLAIPGILLWAWWAFNLLLIFSEGCDPLSVDKCYLVQAGTYLGYDFFPAIAIPILTLVWLSRIRTLAGISHPALETSVSHPRVTESSRLTRTT